MQKPFWVWKITPGSPVADALDLPGAGNLDEAARLLPGGGYTTFRTFGKFGVLRLRDHYERLEETARLTGFDLVLDREAIRAGLRRALEVFPAEEARVRMALDLEQSPGTIYILVESLRVPGEKAYQTGVRVVTRRMQRQNPKAKLTNFLQTANKIRLDLPAEIQEAIMISEDGKALEGLSSNFFAVKSGALWTEDEGVLSGITRSLVLEAARAEEIPLILEGLRVEKFPIIEEAFITSASRAVLPVVEIDGQRIGSGQPGPITRRMSEKYWELVKKHLFFV